MFSTTMVIILVVISQPTLRLLLVKYILWQLSLPMKNIIIIFWRSQISWPHGGSNWPTSKNLDFLFGLIFKYKGSNINPREMCFVHFRTPLPLSLVILLPFLLRLCVVPSRHNSEEHNYLTRHFRRNELNPTTGNVFMHQNISLPN